MTDKNEVLVENARIIFRNFEGREGPFNTKGSRSFSLSLSREEAEIFIKDGWNVKTKEARDEGDDALYHLPIAVKVDGAYPASLYLVTQKGKQVLTPDTVECLDTATFKNVDLIFRPYLWEIPSTGKSGKKAYLQTLFAFLDEDELEKKYADL